MMMLNCSEFTALCPKTSQPDFAKIRIAYILDRYDIIAQFYDECGITEDVFSDIMIR